MSENTLICIKITLFCLCQYGLMQWSDWLCGSTHWLIDIFRASLYFIFFSFVLAILPSSNPFNGLLLPKAHSEKKAWPPLDFSFLSWFYFLRHTVFKEIFYNIQCLGKSTEGSVWSLESPSTFSHPSLSPFSFALHVSLNQCERLCLLPFFVKKKKKPHRQYFVFLCKFLDTDHFSRFWFDSL